MNLAPELIESGQQFSIWCVRVAAAAWFVFAIALIHHSASGRRQSGLGNLPWLLAASWGLGTVLLTIHIGTAFAFFHDMSHNVAAEHTAHRTFEATGIRTSIGIWLNYLTLILCWIETIRWLRYPEKRVTRSWIAIYGFLLFMLFNAAVVFVSGLPRWINLSGFIFVLFFWRWQARAPFTFTTAEGDF